MNKSRLLRIAFTALLVVFAQATRTLAGTTGGRFADQSHMARCMRRVVGMTPSSVLRNCG